MYVTLLNMCLWDINKRVNRYLDNIALRHQAASLNTSDYIHMKITTLITQCSYERRPKKNKKKSCMQWPKGELHFPCVLCVCAIAIISSGIVKEFSQWRSNNWFSCRLTLDQMFTHTFFIFVSVQPLSLFTNRCTWSKLCNIQLKPKRIYTHKTRQATTQGDQFQSSYKICSSSS